uniref:RTP1_C1 domain-containing protein n=1 Tax=Rhabditophanes sp. KR3021 TaxID=114890 RepID=A0AC35TH70_9BILA
MKETIELLSAVTTYKPIHNFEDGIVKFDPVGDLKTKAIEILESRGKTDEFNAFTEHFKDEMEEFKFDPVGDLKTKAIEILESRGKTDEFNAFTERFKDEMEECKDPRLTFGLILCYLYNKIVREYEEAEDKDMFLSMQEEQVFLKSFDFFVPVNISSCLKPRVGVPLAKRMRKTPLKEWKAFDKENICIKLLSASLDVFYKLLLLDNKFKSSLLKNYTIDFFVGNLQLMNYRCSDHRTKYEEYMSKVMPRSHLFKALFQLIHIQENPPWLARLYGSTLSYCLRAQNGIFTFFTAIASMTSPSFFDNPVAMDQLAHILSVAPRNVDINAYYSNVLAQIGALVLHSQLWGCRLALFYGYLIDKVYEKAPHVVVICFLKNVVKPWTDLIKKGILMDKDAKRGYWSVNMDRSIVLMTVYLKSGKGAVCEELSKMVRNSGLIYMWLYFIKDMKADVPVSAAIIALMSNLFSPSADKEYGISEIEEILFDNESKKYAKVRELVRFFSFKVVEKSAVEVKQPDDELFHFSNVRLYILEDIEELDEEDEFKEDVTVLEPLLNNPKLLLELMGRLLTCVCTNSKDDNLTEMEIMKKNRFVQIEKPDMNFKHIYFLQHAIHFFYVQYCNDDDKNGVLEDNIVGILNISTLVLGRFNKCRIIEDFTLRSLEFAIALSASLIFIGRDQTEFRDAVDNLANTLRKFVTIVTSKFKDNQTLMDLSKRAEELSDFYVTEFKAKIVQGDLEDSVDHSETKRTHTKRTLYDECMEDLEDDFAAFKGHAFIVIAREVRNKNLHFLTADKLQHIFEKTTELINDFDSYVFLSGISVLAEISYLQCDPYLLQLIHMFANWEDKENISLRGKLGEAIAKVCMQLGDIAPAYFDTLAAQFLKIIREKDEILIASALNGMADLITSCKGNKYGEIINELLLAINHFVRSNDSSPLVRRSALHLLRCILHSTDTQILLGTVIPMDVLKQIVRELRRLHTFDLDDVVKLHAELCMTDIKEAMDKSAREVSDSMTHVLKF